MRRISLLAVLLVAVPALAKGRGKTQLELSVKPVTAEVFVDGKAMGKATAGRILEVTPGFHVIKLVYKGDESEERVKVPAGEKTTYRYEFDEGKPSGGGDDLDQPAPMDSP